MKKSKGANYETAPKQNFQTIIGHDLAEDLDFVEEFEEGKSAEKNDKMRPENTFGKTPIVGGHEADFILMEDMNSGDNMTSPEQDSAVQPTTSPDITQYEYQDDASGGNNEAITVDPKLDFNQQSSIISPAFSQYLPDDNQDNEQTEDINEMNEIPDSNQDSDMKRE